MFTLVQAGVPCKWVNDSQRFLLEWFDVISSSPSQLYYSALQLCPSSSWLRECYDTELLHQVRVVKGLPTEWGICSRTVMLQALPLALAHWKNTIAVGLLHGKIITLDRITGSQTAILSGHTSMVKSLVFSPDGTLLVSGGQDKTIKLWDLQTGGVIKTFHGHTNSVVSVSISADCTMIASGSWDKTIRLWNIQTEECHCVIEQQDHVVCVRFSPTDPQCLISVSGNKVQQWDTNGHQTKPALNGSCVAFSLDGTQLVLCQGEDIVVQNSDSGMIATKFHAVNSRAEDCCFSPDGRLIAIAVWNTAYVWDTTGSHPHSIDTFVGHTDDISSLVFSSPSSLISSSCDGSVKFWQTGALHTDPVVTDPESTPLTSASIQSVALQAEDGIAISCDSEGMVKTWDISTGLCKAFFQTPVKNPQESDVRLINSRLILVWFAGIQICVWDGEKGKFALKNSNPIKDLRISGDGSTVFCLNLGSIQARLIQTGEVVAEVELGGSYLRRYLTVVGSRVWVHSSDSELLGWDLGIPGSPPVQLSNTTLPHPNGTKLWDAHRSRIKDTITGEVVFQLAGRFSSPVDSQWDGRYLVAGYGLGEVLILDFNHMLL